MTKASSSLVSKRHIISCWTGERHIGEVGRTRPALIELGPERLRLDTVLHQCVTQRDRDIAGCARGSENNAPLNADLDRQHAGVDMTFTRGLAEGCLHTKRECRLIPTRTIQRIGSGALPNIDARTINRGISLW